MSKSLLLFRPKQAITTVAGSFRYASTIDPGLTDLYAKWAHDGGTGLPIVVIMHGYTGSAADATPAIMRDMAGYGFFALAVGMRGRDGASGTPDVSARELQDIVDAVEHVKANFGAVVDPTEVHVTGYSGGGANAMALACRYPDFFAVVASHFGISDYGYDATFGWGDQEPTRQASLAGWTGFRARSDWAGSATVDVNAYRARNALEAIAVNRLGGHVFLYHDAGDGVVDVTQSSRARDAFVAASNARHTYSETEAGDEPRWLHDMPHPVGDSAKPEGAQVRFTREGWGAAILAGTYPAWTVATAGSVRVIGAIVTKRYSVWLGDGDRHVADVTYDTAADSYTVTPLTGTMTVTVAQGAKTVTATISAATVLTPV